MSDDLLRQIHDMTERMDSIIASLSRFAGTGIKEVSEAKFETPNKGNSMKKKTMTSTDREAYRLNKVTVYDNAILEDEAVFANSCIERWGMVACIPDGEDSSGRQKLRLASPDELVERAYQIAELAYKAAAARGLVLELPDLAEIQTKLEEQGAA